MKKLFILSTLIFGICTTGHTAALDNDIATNAYFIGKDGPHTVFQRENAIIDAMMTSEGIDYDDSSFQEHSGSSHLILDFENDNSGSTTTESIGTQKYTVSWLNGAIKSTSDSKFGAKSLELDGSDDYLTLPDSSDWDIFGSSTDDWTVDLWVKVDSLSHSEHYALLRQWDSASDNWALQINGSNQLWLWVNNTIEIAGSDDTTINDLGWNHVALVKKGSHYGMYLNGVQGGYKSSTSTFTFDSNLYIGHSPHPSFPEWFDGKMDDIRITKGNVFNANPVDVATETPDKIQVPTRAATIWSDNEHYFAPTSGENMKLVSTSHDTGSSDPKNAYIVVYEEDVDSITINTDLKAFVSCNTLVEPDQQITLNKVVDHQVGKTMYEGSTTTPCSGGPGSDLRYMLQSDNTKDLKIHGVALSWD